MMSHHDVRELILQEKLVAIARRVPSDKIGKVAQALVRGGVKLLEVTFDQESAEPVSDYTNCLRAIRESVGEELCLGAGTVLSTSQVVAAHAAGARYIVSPSTNESVVRLTRTLGMVSIPGAMTPTEIVTAYELGGDIIKLFPADDLGYHYIWNIRAPLPHIPLMASGGVNADTIPEFLKHGMACVGSGAGLINSALLASEDYSGIEAAAQACVKAIHDFQP